MWLGASPRDQDRDKECGSDFATRAARRLAPKGRRVLLKDRPDAAALRPLRPAARLRAAPERPPAEQGADRPRMGEGVRRRPAVQAARQLQARGPPCEAPAAWRVGHLRWDARAGHQLARARGSNRTRAGPGGRLDRRRGRTPTEYRHICRGLAAHRSCRPARGPCSSGVDRGKQAKKKKERRCPGGSPWWNRPPAPSERGAGAPRGTPALLLSLCGPNRSGVPY